MSGTFNLIKDFMSALNASEQNKTQPYDTQGTVKRVEGDTAWVQFTGSDRETPVQMTIACDVGDTVQARIGGGSAWLTGNLTAPPTDDKKANQAITMVTNIAETVQETVEEALEDVSSVEDVTVQYCLSDSSSTFTQYGDWSNTPPTYVSGKYYWTRTVLYDEDGNEVYGTPQYSQDTQLSVETDVAFKSNNNHFWHDSSGAYVTTADKSYANGSAVRITASGILQQVNGSTVSSWTNSGISFLQSGSTVASFGSGGVNLYGSGSLGASVTSSGMDVYSSGSLAASFGSTAQIGKTSGFNMYLQSRTLNFRYNGSTVGQLISNGSVFQVTSPNQTNVEGTNVDVKGSGTGEWTDDPAVLIEADNGTIRLDSKSSGVFLNKRTTPVFGPIYDSSIYCGSSNYRWAVIYAADNTIKTSDAKDKDFAGDIPFAHDLIMALKPIEYYWKKGDHRRKRMGFIAQETSEICKALGQNLNLCTATYKENEKPYYGEDVDDELLVWGMSYAELIAPLVKVVQDQNNRITELEERLS